MGSPLRLDGKVVIVTGAGGGIGRELALALAAAGACVVVNDVGTSPSGVGTDTGPAQTVVGEIRALGGEAVASTDSVAGWESARRIVSTALDAFGRLDSVVNNAGIIRDRLFFDLPPDDWRAVVDTNLNGVFYLSRAAAPHFKKQASGSYVHMTSASALIGNLGQASYSAAKLGVVALSKSIALDMARYSVRSNCIAPFAWSRLTETIPTDTPEGLARAERFRAMDAAKVAPLVVYLASGASADVSGQIFAVRANEIFLMGQSRPLRSVHRGEGWTPDSVAAHAMLALRSTFVPLEVSADVFGWDPV
jgi:NAD(P)-dependent dehydrogenase (short-subunit alcohol dehydrogenase family)